jgi:glycine cleavage system transcriptional repressor
MADRNHLILTAVGPDQIGLVEKISEFIARQGSNIEDSKMAVFCGEFALIILISGEGGNLHKIANHYRELEIETGLAISIKTPTSRKPAESFLPYTLTASCMDHPGIVYLITGILSSFGINIESMETKTYAAPVSGTPIFRLEAEISVPTKSNINALRERFARFKKTKTSTLSFPWSMEARRSGLERFRCAAKICRIKYRFRKTAWR